MSTNIADQRVSANVRAELARAGLSQAALARELGVSPSGLSRRISGKRSFMVSELSAIANVIHVPVHVLVGVHASEQAAS